MTNNLGRLLKRLLGRDEAATSTEYAVMFAMILLVCIGAIVNVGGKVTGVFSNFAAQMP